MFRSISILFRELFNIPKAYIKKRGWVIEYIKIMLTIVHLLVLLYELLINAWA